MQNNMDETAIFHLRQNRRYLCFDNIQYPLIRRYEEIGRDKESHIYLQNPNISMHHAKIKVCENNTFIKDLNSKNGTKLNKTPISPYCYYQLKNENVIFFGNCLEAKFIECENFTDNNHGDRGVENDASNNRDTLTNDDNEEVEENVKVKEIVNVNTDGNGGNSEPLNRTVSDSDDSASDYNDEDVKYNDTRDEVNETLNLSVLCLDDEKNGCANDDIDEEVTEIVNTDEDEINETFNLSVLHLDDGKNDDTDEEVEAVNEQVEESIDKMLDVDNVDGTDDANEDLNFNNSETDSSSEELLVDRPKEESLSGEPNEQCHSRFSGYYLRPRNKKIVYNQNNKLKSRDIR